MGICTKLLNTYCLFNGPLDRKQHVLSDVMRSRDFIFIFVIMSHHVILRPLHTRAKSRDHEIQRAQQNVSKGRPNTPPKSCRVVMDPLV